MKFLIEWFTFGKQVTSTRVVCLRVSSYFLLIKRKQQSHTFIPANRISCYEDDLKACVVYKIKNLLVINNKTSYKVISHKFLIQFTQQTIIDQKKYIKVEVQ
ncbi:hypothetical protein HID58_024704 [Brassica napus]|uniref:Replication protein A 70 kDa DNA-binding subunit B/D first OB fold domain-containing protein n=1 Tax=Brassica napus TaxID=3708 RepID=A0ABQ8CIX9_BRANA|nr:hypothetical protein HID58_024704 [Brassica napus]